MGVKKRILFVDDEIKVLDGLRRMLHSMRNEWEMRFALSGAEALTIMDSDSFDVIVTDMRMPGMSGADLLREVRKRHPQTVRIVLSGQTKRENILKSITPIHQFLSKPCEAGKLKSTIVRAFALRELLNNDKLKAFISKVESLPSLPVIYHEIVDALQSEDASTGMVGKIIAKDIGMSAKILQLVNSAFFGLARHVSDPEQAVILLGLKTVKSLVLSVHMFSQFDQSKLKGISLTSLWEHSITVAAFAKRIAKAEILNPKSADDAFMAGLLHDVGKLVLATNFPQEYSTVLSLADKEKIEVHEVEYNIFGSSHGEVGAYLLGLWGLPESLILTSAFHHCPQKNPEKNFDPLTIIHVANVFENETTCRRGLGVIPTIDHAYLAELGLTERLPKWKKICEETI